MYMPLSAFNRPGNDKTTHQVQSHSLFRFIFIQRHLSIPHILRECANKSHQQNLTYLHYRTHKLEILVLSSVPICFFRSKWKKYEHMIWWTCARFTMKKSISRTLKSGKARSHSRLIPQVSRTASFSSCHLSLRISTWQGFTKGHQTQ